MTKISIYQLVEKGTHGRKYNLIFDYIILSMIFLSIVLIILESITEINIKYRNTLFFLDILTVIIFTIEYILRIYVSDLSYPAKNKIHSAIKFITSTEGIIDLLAILPFYLPVIFKMDLRFIRILRITRFLRILKINRYNNSLKIIGEVIKEKKTELLVTVFVTLITLLLASVLVFHIEHEAQPESFPNIIAAFWWAMATLTTVGYGDVYPVTALGKVISSIIAIMGIGIVALPTGIISAGFIDKIDRKKSDLNIHCPNCGTTFKNNYQ